MTSSEREDVVSAALGQIKPPANAAHCTEVLYKWADWHHQQGYKRPRLILVFRKGDVRLVVHEYEPRLCGVLKLADVNPKVRDFREWKESSSVVQAKLLSRGWIAVPGKSEVSHAHAN